jgi:hypothetical protein
MRVAIIVVAFIRKKNKQTTNTKVSVLVAIFSCVLFCVSGGERPFKATGRALKRVGGFSKLFSSRFP